MVQYDEIPATKVRKRKREVMMDRSAEDKPTPEESFLICDDCKHSSDTILLETEPAIVVVINQ